MNGDRAITLALRWASDAVAAGVSDAEIEGGIKRIVCNCIPEEAIAADVFSLALSLHALCRAVTIRGARGGA